jgi:hypothetical protein
MNKYKVLGAALMVSIILATLAAYNLGLTSIQYATSGVFEGLLFMSSLAIVLFSAFASLTLDKLRA